MKSRTFTALTMAFAFATVLTLPAVADAGTYRVYSCKTPTGAVAPTDGWSASEATGGNSLVANDCAAGGSLRAHLSGDHDQAAGWFAEWHFDVPEDVALRGFRAWRSMSTTNMADTNATPVTFISWPEFDAGRAQDSCANSAGCVAKGLHDLWSSPGNYFAPSVQASPRTVYFAAACVGSASGRCLDRNSGVAMADLRIHAVDATLEDLHAPVVGSVGGPLVATSPHRGKETINFTATDLGAGVYRALIEVRRSGASTYDTAVARIPNSNGGRCADAGADAATIHEFVHVVPCAAWISSDLQLDTTSLPDGTHELRVRVEDASGNSTNVHGPVAFEVDNVPPPGVSDPDGAGPSDGLPSIAGDPVVGSTLVGDKGTWSGDGLTHAMQWLRCSSATDATACTPIPGATGQEYRLTAEDLAQYVRLRVTGSNAQGSTSAVSAPKGPVAAAPSTAPAQSGGGGTGSTPAAASPGDRSMVDDGSPANGTNASDHAVLTITGKRRRTLAFRRATRVVATLRDERGRPISGARVDVLRKMSVPGAAWSIEREPLTTDPHGRLSWRVPARYGRTIRLAYKANLANTGYQAVADLLVKVRSKTTIRTSKRFLRNGQRVAFSGRLLARPVPAGGVLIDMQARVGRRWQTFETTRAKRSGRWSTGYRFRSTRGLQTYVFRARVRQDTGYPFAISRSKSVRVRVTG